MPAYLKQIVCFFDLLGFSNMLDSFEQEAMQNEDPTDDDYHESQRVNRLLDIISRVLLLVKKDNCTYNVFSDNICLRFTYEGNPNVFVEVLVLASLLMKEFIKEGYFIRGGIAVGWCLDSADVIVGTPLVRAYKHESVTANYPRVVLDNEYVRLLNECLDAGEIEEQLVPAATGYIICKDDVYYINNFFYVSNFEENESKIDFLQTYSYHIGENLRTYKRNEKVFPKYKALAEDFNAFIQLIIETPLDQEQPFNEQQIAHLATLKLPIR